MVTDTLKYLKQFDLWQTELLEIELFDSLTVCIYKICLENIYLKHMKKTQIWH